MKTTIKMSEELIRLQAKAKAGLNYYKNQLEAGHTIPDAAGVQEAFANFAAAAEFLQAVLSTSDEGIPQYPFDDTADRPGDVKSYPFKKAFDDVVKGISIWTDKSVRELSKKNPVTDNAAVLVFSRSDANNIASFLRAKMYKTERFSDYGLDKFDGTTPYSVRFADGCEAGLQFSVTDKEVSLTPILVENGKVITSLAPVGLEALSQDCWELMFVKGGSRYYLTVLSVASEVCESRFPLESTFFQMRMKRIQEKAAEAGWYSEVNYKKYIITFTKELNSPLERELTVVVSCLSHNPIEAVGENICYATSYIDDDKRRKDTETRRKQVKELGVAILSIGKP